jgi:threonine dehydrogenase-like Zn-dependent dehydrogenase
MMHGICFQTVETVQWRTVEQPELIDPRDAIVRVSVAGLCGSDLHPFLGREPGLDAGTVMGHEVVGTIVELGESAAKSGLQIGNRVFAPFSTSCGECFYCQSGLTARCELGQLFGWRSQGKGLHGCQAELVRIPLAAGTLMKIPTGISDGDALLLGDNFSTGYFCAEMAEVKPDGVYAVIGCGTVGQLCLQVAQKMGARKLFAIDPVPHRRLAGERWGAIPLEPGEPAVAALRQATKGRGADGVMELVGLPQAQALAYQLLRPGGTMSVIGCHCTPHFAFSPVDAYDKNLTYRTGRCSARHYMGVLTDRVAKNEFDLSGVITHQFAPDECSQAYDIFANQKDGCVKAVFAFE